MGVCKVVEDWAGSKFSVEIDPVTLRPAGSGNRAFDVYFTEDDTSFKPLSALTAIGPDGTRIPQPWEILDLNNPWVYVTGYSPSMSEEMGPFMVKVTVNYKIFEDPLSIPPKKRWYFSTVPDVLQAGCVPGHPALIRPILNSAGEAPDTPMMTDYNDLVLMISWNRAAYDPNLASRYMKAVNSDTFFGFPPGKVKCKVFTGDDARAGGLLYYEHNYEFHIRTFESDPLNIGWLRRFRDEGFHEMVLNDQNHLVPRAFGEYLIEYSEETGLETDRKFKPVSKPVALDGAGRKLADGAPDHFIEIQDFDQLPFSVLGLE
jgi:hypothetical protein